ncbi:MAG: prepilin-type N-terminal cleavage/methylation domain-containing protein [Candidatus Doudnabacteria bacterium]|nr:prepilin-type N-terminal cleavage/methylation domain-containing protein [Candidatus Doudnabacteria bacterium]
MSINKKEKLFRQKAFTIIEFMVSLAVFTILVSAMLGTFALITRTTKTAREKTILSSLAINYLEIVRNMPYAQVGTISGNPVGTLPDAANAYVQTLNGSTYKIYYEVTYIDDPADGTVLAGTDPAPADYKQVKMGILNTGTGQVTNFLTTVVPKGLEGTNNAGALLINVIDSQGNPVSGANIHITYPTTTPTLILDRQSDGTGQWIEVGLPAAVNNYHIVVTKTGYSTDQTYPLTGSNPNPTKPDATIVNGQVTKITFAIDLLANLNIKTLNSLCQPISGVNVNVRGAKIIGTGPPVVYKFNNSYSSVAGLIALNNIEWDTYTPTLLTGQSYIIYGTSPIQKIDVLPGTTQTYTMILGTNTTAYSLLVIVKDASTGTALEGATVHLHKGGSVPQDYYGTTGGSVWVQQDYSGGSGAVNWSTTTPDRYFQDDGNIDANSAPTGLRLLKISGRYVASGWLESSTFDTGTNATNYTILSWQPTSQSASTTLSFQVAANNDNATWNYIGPDGTSATYFTTPGVDIGSALDGNRYVRYKAYLSSTDDKKTPVLTSVNLNFVTGCFTPGQVMFPDLTAGNNYSLTIDLPGYQSQTIDPLTITGNQSLEVLMSP